MPQSIIPIACNLDSAPPTDAAPVRLMTGETQHSYIAWYSASATFDDMVRACNALMMSQLKKKCEIPSSNTILNLTDCALQPLKRPTQGESHIHRPGCVCAWQRTDQGSRPPER